jgi:hypothetical protein
MICFTCLSVGFFAGIGLGVAGTVVYAHFKAWKTS